MLQSYKISPGQTEKCFFISADFYIHTTYLVKTCPCAHNKLCEQKNRLWLFKLE